MLENKQVEKIMNTTDSNLSLSLSPIELATVLSFVSADSVIGIPSDLLSSSQEHPERFQAGVDSLVSRHILTKQDGKYDGDPLLFLHMAVIAEAWVTITVESDDASGLTAYYFASGRGTRLTQTSDGNYDIIPLSSDQKIIDHLQHQLKQQPNSTLTVYTLQADAPTVVEELPIDQENLPITINKLQSIFAEF